CTRRGAAIRVRRAASRRTMRGNAANRLRTAGTIVRGLEGKRVPSAPELSRPLRNELFLEDALFEPVLRVEQHLERNVLVLAHGNFRDRPRFGRIGGCTDGTALRLEHFEL